MSRNKMKQRSRREGWLNDAPPAREYTETVYKGPMGIDLSPDGRMSLKPGQRQEGGQTPSGSGETQSGR